MERKRVEMRDSSCRRREVMGCEALGASDRVSCEPLQKIKRELMMSQSKAKKMIKGVCSPKLNPGHDLRLDELGRRTYRSDEVNDDAQHLGTAGKASVQVELL
jgi:hypothetical protein